MMVSKGLKSTPAVTCLKILLGTFNAILWIVGAVLLGVGIYSKMKLMGYDLLTTTDYSNAPYVLIGIGVFIVLVGFFGCCAVTKGNTCMLRTYGFTLGVLFLAEITLAIVVVVYRAQVFESFNEGMTKAIKQYNIDDDYKNAVNNAQHMLHCCGVQNYTDYNTIALWLPRTLPASCCVDDEQCKPYVTKDIATFPDNKTLIEELVYPKGCPEVVVGSVDNNLGIILGVLFGVAGFQLIGFIFACCLASKINANKYELV